MGNERLKAQLRLELQKKLMEIAKKEKDENPSRDEIFQSISVIHKLEEFGEEMKAKIFAKEGKNLTQNEIYSLVQESTGKVLKVLFKGII
jgi:hypothetical protein